jgi:site-specific recombinase XerD
VDNVLKSPVAFVALFRSLFGTRTMSNHLVVPGNAGTSPSSAAVATSAISKAARLNEQPRTIPELLPYYVAFSSHEWGFSPRTVATYVEGIKRVLKVVGDITPEQIDLERIVAVKADLAANHAGEYHVRHIVNSLRSFLRFSRLVFGLNVIDPKTIAMPRISKREVVFLKPLEIEQFVSAIPAYDESTKRMDVRWLGFRCLVEVLLATGMRITEALSLRTTDVKLDTGEAQIVGKGNKQRTVFFTPRALGWVREFVNRRSDRSERLFVCPNGAPFTVNTVQKNFRFFRSRSGLSKRVSPHILRHTCATTLLFNGCPIGFIKEVLGHDRLETTCRYYLGVDKKAAKEAHQKYLTF